MHAATVMLFWELLLHSCGRATFFSHLGVLLVYLHITQINDYADMSRLSLI